MLDKNAIKVLKYFIKTKDYQDKYTIACNVNLSVEDDKLVDLVEIAINDLVETNCIKNTKWGYQLTSYGKNYFKTSFDNIFFKYIYPLITAGISFVLSLLVD